MKIFLLNPPYKKGFIRSARWADFSISGSNWYPIWLSYAAGLLMKNKHKVLLLDALADSLPINETIDRAKKFNPKIVVIYTSTKSLEDDLEIAKYIKNKTNAKIIFVGPWCFVAGKRILSSPIVDIITIGEFDYQLLDLANNVPLNKIKGIWWKKDGKIFKNSNRNPTQGSDLDSFPYVTKIYNKFLNFNNYFQAPHRYPFVDLYTGRSCYWGKCTFCLWPYSMNLTSSYRTRNIHNVIQEIKYIIKHLPMIKEIFFQDDTLSPKRAKDLSTELINNKINITWSCYLRGEVNLEILKLMKQAGCRLVHVGYESGNDKILRNINKGVTVKQLEEFSFNCQRAKIMVHGDFIVGLPGETIDTIKRTINWAKKLPIHSYQFTYIKPYPGTPIYDWLVKNNSIKDEEVNLPNFSNKKILYWTKRAIRDCHLNKYYLMRMIKYPSEWPRLIKGAFYVIPELFNKNLNV